MSSHYKKRSEQLWSAYVFTKAYSWLKWITNFQFNEVEIQTTFIEENGKEQNIQFIFFSSFIVVVYFTFLFIFISQKYAFQILHFKLSCCHENTETRRGNQVRHFIYGIQLFDNVSYLLLSMSNYVISLSPKQTFWIHFFRIQDLRSTIQLVAIQLLCLRLKILTLSIVSSIKIHFSSCLENKHFKSICFDGLHTRNY